MSDERRSLEGLFGPLEADIMEVLWQKNPATPSEVREALAPGRNLAYTTVMTVLGRLHEKGFLSREKEGRAFSYTPNRSKVELLRERASSAIRALSKAGPAPALSYFVDAASSLDADQLAALEQEIARLREKRS